MGGPSFNANPIPANVTLQNTLTQCIILVEIDQENIDDSVIRNAVEELPQCPPTETLNVISPEFTDFSDNCFRSRAIFDHSDPLLTDRPYEFVSICCYSSDG